MGVFLLLLALLKSYLHLCLVIFNCVCDILFAGFFFVRYSLRSRMGLFSLEGFTFSSASTWSVNILKAPCFSFRD